MSLLSGFSYGNVLILGVALMLCVFVLIQILRVALPRFFLVPPQDWRDKIADVLNRERPVYLNVGMKRSSYRRRLVLASSNPTFYTNFINNKLKIYDGDSRNKNEFLNCMKYREASDPRRNILFGFFHPYANNGGGGEKVLWQAVNATLRAHERNIAVVYTTNIEVQPADIIKKANIKHNVKEIDSRRVLIIYLRRFAPLIDEKYWKHFTILGQMLGSALLSFEAMNEISPDVWVDTIGFPGSYLPVSIILRIPIISYVHYPIIQQDMFKKLKFCSFSSDQFRNFELTPRDFFAVGKLIYWSFLYYVYVYLGSKVDITLTNGTWTFDHISNIWSLNTKAQQRMKILYPPCVSIEESLGKTDLASKENKMIYIGQFRPEKRHKLILEEYATFLCTFTKRKGNIKTLPTITFLGSCRTPNDTEVLKDVRERVHDLKLDPYVEFMVDSSYNDLRSALYGSKFGLNAMWNEHFGIGVVEYLSHGVIPISHASAGPWLDIVVNNEEPNQKWFNDLGFFFKSVNDPDFKTSLQEEDVGMLNFEMTSKNHKKIIGFPSLSHLLIKLFLDSPELVDEDRLSRMRDKATQLASNKFSDETFMHEWSKYIHYSTSLEQKYRKEKRSVPDIVY